MISISFFIVLIPYTLYLKPYLVNPSKRFFELFLVGIPPTSSRLRVGWSGNSPSVTAIIREGVSFLPFNDGSLSGVQFDAGEVFFAVFQKTIFITAMTKIVVNPSPASLQAFVPRGILGQDSAEFDLSVVHFDLHCAYSLSRSLEKSTPQSVFFHFSLSGRLKLNPPPIFQNQKKFESVRAAGGVFSHSPQIIYIITLQQQQKTKTPPYFSKCIIMYMLLSTIHQENNTGMLATGYTAQIQNYITGNGEFESGYAKNHILRELNRKLSNYGLSGYIYDPVDAGFRPITLTGILAA